MAEPRVRSVGPEIDRRAGQIIFKLRTALDWDLEDLAFEIRDRTGETISVAVLRSIEDPKKNRRLSLGEAAAIAKTFEVTVDSLVRWT